MIDGCLDELVLTAYQLENFAIYHLIESFAKAVSAPSIRIESTRIPKQVKLVNIYFLHKNKSNLAKYIAFEFVYGYYE